ncbi:MAG: hypothetical protein EA396_06655 [Anaerolineaceae bacterium]|nr:MAG: hypothetical protein EA396_06655 [Anaerolineaceae bacterium]
MGRFINETGTHHIMKRIALIVGLVFSLGWLIAQAQTTEIIAVIDSDTTRSGYLDDNTPFVEFPLRITEDGVTLTIDLRATGGDLDPLLYLLDESGNIIAENDDYGRDTRDSRIVFPRIASGAYSVVATRYGVTGGETTGNFEMRVALDESSIPTLDYDVSASALTERGFPQMASAATATWTILAYYGGDANIEEAILQDFKRFEIAGGSDETIRIIALLDRSPAFSTASGDWSGAKLFEVTASYDDSLSPPTIDSQPLADLGTVNSGDGALLAQFLTWGVQHYPAEHYAIVLASHGAGWQGIVTDFTFDSIISLPELQSAFSAARDMAGVERFDLLINDACSMSTVEYHMATSEFFDISIASPEIVVEPALNMAYLASTLRDDPTINTTQLGRGLIDTYIERDLAERPGSDSGFMTHAATDLQQFSAVTEAVEAFAQQINRDPQRHRDLIGMARANVYTYSFFIGDDSMVDAGHFMQQIIALSDDVELTRRARDVIAALEDARLYGASGQWAGDWTSYYSIYFPALSRRFNNDYLEQSPLDEWAQMLRNYYNAVTPRLWRVEDSIITYHPPVAPEVAVTQIYPDVGSHVFPPTIRMEVTGRALTSGSFTVDQIDDEGRKIRILDSDILTEIINDERIDLINSWKSGVDQSFFSWLPLNLPVISDGTTRQIELIQRTGRAASLQGRYREIGGERWFDATVLFDENGEVFSVLSRADGSGAVGSVTIPRGAEFQAFRYVVTERGQVKSEPGTVYIWGENGLTLSEEITPNGQYELGFLVEAFGGTSGFDSVMVTIDGAEADLPYRGYADLERGLNFQHPKDWPTVGDIGDRMTTANTSDTVRLNVYYEREDGNNLTRIADDFIRDYNLTASDTPRTPTTIDDQPALIFDFSYEDATHGRFDGRAFAVWRPGIFANYAVVFAVEATPQARSIGDEVFQHLLDSTRFFDARSLAERDASRWRYEFLDRNLPYPVPREWQTQTLGDWRIYSAPDSAETWARVARLEAENRSAAIDDLLASYQTEEILERRTYISESHVWESVTYRRVNSPASIGRIYATRIGGQIFVIWFETPENATTFALFREIFEPMVDGFAPLADVIYADGNVRSAFITAGVNIVSSICADAMRDQLCYGEGALTLEMNAPQTVSFDESGDRSPIASIQQFDVGFLSDRVDPFSIAQMNVQGNQPDATPEQMVQLIVFGGTSIINNGYIPADYVERVSLQNQRDVNFFIRAMPDENAAVVGILPIGERIDAIERSADGLWLRVRLPDAPGTGWIFRPLFGDDLPEVDALRIGNPDADYIAPMASLEILLSDDPNSLNGVLIITPPGNYTAEIVLNDLLFSIDGGSMFFWNGDFDQLQDIQGFDQDFSNPLNRRRPSGWSSRVLRGTIRITVPGTEGEESITIEASAGEEIRQTAASSEVAVRQSSRSSLNNVVNTVNRAGRDVSYEPPVEFEPEIEAIPTPLPPATFTPTPIPTEVPPTPPPPVQPPPQPTATLPPPTATVPPPTATPSPVPDQADVGVSINVSPSNPELGDAVTFTVVITNHGPLPAQINYRDYSFSHGSIDAGGGPCMGGIMIPPDSGPDLALAVGESVTIFTLTRTFSPNDAAQVNVSAEITNSTPDDPNPNNNSASVVVSLADQICPSEQPPSCEGEECYCEGEPCLSPPTICEGEECDDWYCEGEECDDWYCEGEECDYWDCIGEDCGTPQ